MGKIKAYFTGEIIFSNSAEAHFFYEKSVFGEPVGGKINYSFPEALFLSEEGKMEIFSKSGKKINHEEMQKKIQRLDKKIDTKYSVFKDMRKKGHILKTALKFGADFRAYEKGKMPGEEHAKWLVFSEKETGKFSWSEFSAKNRVAHSTKKILLLAIVDEEGDVTYYEVGWVRP